MHEEDTGRRCVVCGVWCVVCGVWCVWWSGDEPRRGAGLGPTSRGCGLAAGSARLGSERSRQREEVAEGGGGPKVGLCSEEVRVEATRSWAVRVPAPSASAASAHEGHAAATAATAAPAREGADAADAADAIWVDQR